MNEFSPRAFFDVPPELEPLFSGLAHAWEGINALPAFIEASIRPGLAGTVEDGAWVEPGKVELAEGAVIQRGAIVHGPTIIGPGTTVRSGAFIRGHVWTGRNCMIGHGTEVRQVLMMDGSSLPHLNLFFTSLLGNRVRVGGGSYSANFLLTGKEISVRFTDRQDRRFDFPTGSKLFGCVVGDDAVVGAQSLLLPGALVGRGGVAMPQTQVSGYVPAGWKVMPELAPFKLVAPQEAGK